MFQFAKDASINERVSCVAPAINSTIESFELEDTGVEAFQEKLLKMTRDAGLLEEQRHDVENVGVHPDNREGSMLVPVDAQDLLRHWVVGGWSWAKWNALATPIPSGNIGDEWRAKNAELAKNSNGMLAPCNADKLAVVTGMGSHGTAALRALKMGAKGAEGLAEFCDDKGCLSMSKVLERQPSMKLPFEQGCPYSVIRAELCLACPRMMENLSRAGNASHNVYRAQTTLQHCSRIHNIAINVKDGNNIEWDDVARKASVGMGPDFFKAASHISAFVRAWSGGSDAHILKDLEKYEKTLKIKRKLYPSDLGELAKIDSIDLPKYVPAMVKTMLNSPTADATGHANVFTSNDFASVCALGRNKPFARDANKLMGQAETFLTAYARISDAQRQKLCSELEVRLVMHVHQKRYDTRVSFPSQIAIASIMHADAKKLDDKLPSWNILKNFTAPTHSKGPNDSNKPLQLKGGLREVRDDGIVPTSELTQRGFEAGVHVKKSTNDVVFEITSIDDEHNIDVKVKPITGNQHETTINRTALCNEYVIQAKIKDKVWLPAQRPPTTMCNYNMLCAIYGGHIKHNMVEIFGKSGEHNVAIRQEPKIGVHIIKAMAGCKLETYCTHRQRVVHQSW